MTPLWWWFLRAFLNGSCLAEERISLKTNTQSKQHCNGKPHPAVRGRKGENVLLPFLNSRHFYITVRVYSIEAISGDWIVAMYRRCFAFWSYLSIDVGSVYHFHGGGCTGKGEVENWLSRSVYHARLRCAVAVALSRFFVPFLAYQ